MYKGQSLRQKVEKGVNNYPYYQLQTIEQLELNQRKECFDKFLVSDIWLLQAKGGIQKIHFVPLEKSVYRIFDPKFIGAWSFTQNLMTF